MPRTLNYEKTTKLVLVDCCACSVEYGIPERMNEYLLAKTHTASTYCPNGHQWHYVGKTAEEKVREAEARAAEKIRAAEARVVHAEDQRQAAERRAAAARGQVTKIRNRVGNGVCPCCNRSFANLRRHMTSKHPGFKDESGDA